MTAEEKQAVLDQFGELLMRRVRDEALDGVRLVLNGEMNAPDLQAFAQALDAANFTETQKELLWKAVVQAVDETIFRWLLLVEAEGMDGEMQLLVKSKKTGKLMNVEKCTDGLTAEPFSKDDGWMVRFSQYPPSWVA